MTKSRDKDAETSHYEKGIAEYEAARNAALDSYFAARQHLSRSRSEENLVEAGFRLAWEHFQDPSRKVVEFLNLRPHPDGQQLELLTEDKTRHVLYPNHLTII